MRIEPSLLTVTFVAITWMVAGLGSCRPQQRLKRPSIGYRVTLQIIVVVHVNGPALFYQASDLIRITGNLCR